MNEQHPPDQHRPWSREDHAELKALIADNRGPLRYYLRGVAPHVDHDNIIGETFLELWRQWRTIRGEKAAWIRKVARNKAVDQVRREHTQPMPADDIATWCPASASTPCYPSEYAFLFDLITDCPDHISHCLLLACFDISISEIAQIRQCSEASARQYISRGRKLLREAMARRPDLSPPQHPPGDMPSSEERDS